MKKLILLAILLSIIISIKMEKQEVFLWEATFLHIFISWWLSREIKNKVVKSLCFIALMSTLFITINTMKPFADSILNEICLNSFKEAGRIFEKSGRAIAELGYRLIKSEWRQFNPNETLRRATFGVTISLSFLIIFWEGMKKLPTLKKERR